MRALASEGRSIHRDAPSSAFSTDFWRALWGWVAISEELRAHSFDSWTGQGSEGARAEIEQIRNDCRMWAALAIEVRDLAEIESATLGGQT